MRTRLNEKLRSRRGETLVETVVALLVIVLSSGLLATMVLSATHLNATAMARDKALYAQMNTAQRRDGTVTDGAVTVADSSGNTVSYGVAYYGEIDGLASYTLKGGGAP